MIQITKSGIIRSGITAFSFKPNKPIMNSKNTIIDTIILQKENLNVESKRIRTAVNTTDNVFVLGLLPFSISVIAMAN